jgi:hypothetical protein
MAEKFRRENRRCTRRSRGSAARRLDKHQRRKSCRKYQPSASASENAKSASPPSFREPWAE